MGVTKKSETIDVTKEMDHEHAIGQDVHSDEVLKLANSLLGIRGLDGISLTDERKHKSQLDSVALQALQNAVETANFVGKQAVRHGDLSIDRQWNIDEQGYTAASSVKDLLSSNDLKESLRPVILEVLTDMVKPQEEE